MYILHRIVIKIYRNVTVLYSLNHHYLQIVMVCDEKTYLTILRLPFCRFIDVLHISPSKLNTKKSTVWVNNYLLVCFISMLYKLYHSLIHEHDEDIQYTIYVLAIMHLSMWILRSPLQLVQSILIENVVYQNSPPCHELSLSESHTRPWTFRVRIPHPAMNFPCQNPPPGHELSLSESPTLLWTFLVRIPSKRSIFLPFYSQNYVRNKYWSQCSLSVSCGCVPRIHIAHW